MSINSPNGSLTEKAFSSLNSAHKRVDQAASDATKIKIGPIKIPDFGLFRSDKDKQAIELAQRFDQIMSDLLKKLSDLELMAVQDPSRR